VLIDAALMNFSSDDFSAAEWVRFVSANSRSTLLHTLQPWLLLLDLRAVAMLLARHADYFPESIPAIALQL
jgi:hypothetical protein